MKFQDLYKIITKEKYFVFSFDDIFAFFPDENKSNLEKRIYTWKKRGLISRLKNGLYELAYPQDLIIPDLHIANRLYGPSYVSLETALSYYSVIPEISMAVTSVTTKPTRNFKNKHGLFIYRTIKPNLFTGYHIIKQGNFEILMAEPEKAFIDYLYLNKKTDFKEERFEKNMLRGFNKRKLRNYAGRCGIKMEDFDAYLRGID